MASVQYTYIKLYMYVLLASNELSFPIEWLSQSKCCESTKSTHYRPSSIITVLRMALYVGLRTSMLIEWIVLSIDLLVHTHPFCAQIMGTTLHRCVYMLSGYMLQHERHCHLQSQVSLAHILQPSYIAIEKLNRHWWIRYFTSKRHSII